MFDMMIKTMETWLTPVLQQMEVDLVEFKIHPRGKSISIDVLVDKPQGGITLEECAHVNRFLADQLENIPLTEKDYTIEVSSPGLDRPLKTMKDFKRVVGQPVRFHLTQKLADQLEHTGVIDQVDAEQVTISFKHSSMIIPVAYIAKAVQVID
jgi:ribosome maturation factor RimP